MKTFVASMVVLAALSAVFGETFTSKVGDVAVQAVKDGPVKCPFMSWGADVAFLQANGCSAVTAKGSIYDKLGISVKFYNNDDMTKQVKDYLSGETPFMRCGYNSLAIVSEAVGADPRTKPVVIAKISDSIGDHLVARAEIKNLNELAAVAKSRKIKIAVQTDGAHVGWLYEILKMVQIPRENIEIVWAEDLGGEKSAAAMFRKDATILCAFAITPDMMGLTGGLDKTGNGAEGTVKGAHVVISTAQMSKAIPDVIVCRSDWFAANKPWVEKFVAGYLKGAEEIVAFRKGFEETKKMDPAYVALLNLTKALFPKGMINDIKDDGHGLLMDCVFISMVGNAQFFDDKGNLSGFLPQMGNLLDFATAWGYAGKRRGFDPPGFDWTAIAKLSGTKYVAPDFTKTKSGGRVVAESVNVFGDDIDSRTIFSFSIYFQPNQDEFSPDQYGAEFERALAAASRFGNAAVLVTGNSCPSRTLSDFLIVGMAKGKIQRTGTKGHYTYMLDGKKLDISNVDKIVKMIQDNSVVGSVTDAQGDTRDPQQTYQKALNLSKTRADAVKTAIVAYAKKSNITLDASQIIPVGAGVSQPIIPVPMNDAESSKNRRVEFKIVRVAAEAVQSSDFDY